MPVPFQGSNYRRTPITSARVAHYSKVHPVSPGSTRVVAMNKNDGDRTLSQPNWDESLWHLCRMVKTLPR